MAKEILCAFGVHVDAVTGWLGSYGGEESLADISRGLFAGEVGNLATARPVRPLGHQDQLIRARAFDGDVSRTDKTRGRCRPRIRRPWLQAREPGRADAGPGRNGPRQVRIYRAAIRQEATRIRRAVGELSPATTDLLLKYRLLYDHSIFHHDFTPYYMRVGSQPAVAAMTFL
jgi:peptidoglycan-N-acetylglucosamine deacetylase